MTLLILKSPFGCSRFSQKSYLGKKGEVQTCWKWKLFQPFPGTGWVGTDPQGQGRWEEAPPAGAEPWVFWL